MTGFVPYAQGSSLMNENQMRELVRIHLVLWIRLRYLEDKTLRGICIITSIFH